MQFGLNFFPCVDPAEKSAEQYFRKAIHLAGLTDELGYTHVRQVEHYFKPYGGYSPNPLIFLTAVALRTTKVRLITGAGSGKRVGGLLDHPGESKNCRRMDEDRYHSSLHPAGSGFTRPRLRRRERGGFPAHYEPIAPRHGQLVGRHRFAHRHGSRFGQGSRRLCWRSSD